MKAYSPDLRQRIVDLYNNGDGSVRGLAKRFQVSPDFVHRLIQRYRATGSVAPKAHAGGSQPTLQTEHHLVAARIGSRR